MKEAQLGPEQAVIPSCSSLLLLSKSSTRDACNICLSTTVVTSVVVPCLASGAASFTFNSSYTGVTRGVRRTMGELSEFFLYSSIM